MKIVELMAVLQRYLEQSDRFDVVIPVSGKPSLGYSAVTGIQSVYKGMDWDTNMIFLRPTEPCTVNATELLKYKNFATQLINHYNYCQKGNDFRGFGSSIKSQIKEFIEKTGVQNEKTA